jgi:hypothetical protein
MLDINIHINQDGNLECVIKDKHDVTESYKRTYVLPKVFSLEIRNYSKKVPDFLKNRSITISSWGDLQDTVVNHVRLVVVISLQGVPSERKAIYRICSSANVDDFKHFFTNKSEGFLWYAVPLPLKNPQLALQDKLVNVLSEIIVETCVKIVQIDFYKGFSTDDNDSCWIDDDDKKSAASKPTFEKSYSSSSSSSGSSSSSVFEYDNDDVNHPDKAVPSSMSANVAASSI